jgi:hypothetical protein
MCLGEDLGRRAAIPQGGRDFWLEPTSDFLAGRQHCVWRSGLLGFRAEHRFKVRWRRTFRRPGFPGFPAFVSLSVFVFYPLKKGSGEPHSNEQNASIANWSLEMDYWLFGGSWYSKKSEGPGFWPGPSD